MKNPERHLLLAFLGSLAVLLGASYLALNVSTSLRTSQRQVEQSLQLLTSVKRVRVALTDAETGQRGFIITNNASYLAPYEAAISQIDALLTHLDSLTRPDMPRQHSRVQVLRRLAAAKRDEMHRTIELRRTSGFEAARAEVLTHLGRSYMDLIRRTVDLMEAAENARLTDRARRLAELGRRTTLLYVLSGVLVGSALVLFFTVGLRGLRERQRNADQLREQREWLRVTLASIGDGVIATDVHGAITFMNPIAAALTGWTEQEADGRPVQDVFRIVNEDTRQPVDNPALRAVQEGAIVGLANHTLLLGKDGRETPIDDSGAPIRDSQGQVRGAVLVFREIGERRRVERERAGLLKREQDARAAAEEASHAKDNFLAVASHELRTPIQSLRLQVIIITRAIEEALKAAPQGPELQRLSDLTRVLDADSRRLGDMVSGLLDVTRIASGQFELEVGDADLADSVRTAVAALPQARAGAVPITVDAPDTLPGRWDKRRLEQVVVNLVSNALRYGEGKPIEVALREEGASVVLVVRDRGPGIPAQLLPRIFERFARGAADTHGLGLGLYIAKRIVESHAGTIAIDSTPGGGTTVTVRLPRVTAG